MNWSNYHNHCHYCDGLGTIDQHVGEAIRQSVTNLGFTCHSPVPFENKWSMEKEDLLSYASEINLARKKYGNQINIFKSLEIDYLPGQTTPHDQWIKEQNLDYTLGSIHFVDTLENGHPWEIDGKRQTFMHGFHSIFGSDIQSVIKRYYQLTRQMVHDACPDIIGHLDKIKIQNDSLWNENDDWYQQEILHTLEEIKSSNARIEVNTRGWYQNLTNEPYPGIWILHQIRKFGIPVVLNSDAHHPSQITGYFSKTSELLCELGFKEMQIFTTDGWVSAKLEKEALKM